jgi:hypothetical protein
MEVEQFYAPDWSFTLASEWPVVAGLGHRSDATERPLISVLQSSMREGPRRIIEPPFVAADRSAVDDPDLQFKVLRTGH